jgi:Pvc16 N-terminal domain
MSSALALSAVTAMLQTCLTHVYNASVLGTVNVYSVAPDIVQAKVGTGSDAPLTVNLFLHQVTPNPAWRNIDLPSLATDGATRLKNPPLALDLHYLLTAYAGEDTEAEALLGYAILMLHENPILPRALITSILGSLPSSTYNNAVKSAGIDAQIEMIKITPATLGREEMAWLWTALKADYRPTFPFQASVVLMRNDNPAAFSLPVLARNIVVQAGPPAQLYAVQPPNDQAAAVVGDTVTITGVSLSGASLISIVNPSVKITYNFTPASGAVKDTLFTFKVPEDPTNLPGGICQVSLLYEDSSGNILQHTNALAMAIGVNILSTPAPTAAPSAGGTLITLNCDPQVRAGQTVYLVVGSNAVQAQPFTAATSTLSFQLPTPLAAGTYAARLQVNGVVPPGAANWSFTPPSTLTVLP